MSRDAIEQPLAQPVDFRIINLDSKHGPGTHWVGLITFKGRAYYYDSYGVVPPVEVVQFLNPSPQPEKKPFNLFYQKDQLQNDSNLCGWFVLKFAYEVIKQKKNPTHETNPRLVSEKQVRAFKKRVEKLF